MTEDAPVCLFARFRAHPGQGEALAAAIKPYAELSRAYPGCRAFVVGVGEDPDEILLFEVYDSKAAMSATEGLDEIQAARAAIAPFQAEPVSASEARLLASRGLSFID